MRLDLFLVEKKWTNSRTQAQELIQSGHVVLNKNQKKTVLSKASYQVQDDETDLISVEKNEIQRYVSRGGLKLEHAIQTLNLDIKDFIVLDVGQSTGGFTDCLLQHHAKKVIGVDVGHSQLHEKIKTSVQVTAFEGLHIKDLIQEKLFLEVVPAKGFDLLVADVSFISLSKVMPFIKNFLKMNGDYLLLVKPQFELTAKDLDKNGIVKNSKSYTKVQSQIEYDAKENFGSVLNYFSSEKLGKDGNQEFFIYGKKTI